MMLMLVIYDVLCSWMDVILLGAGLDCKNSGLMCCSIIFGAGCFSLGMCGRMRICLCRLFRLFFVIICRGNCWSGCNCLGGSSGCSPCNPGNMVGRGLWILVGLLQSLLCCSSGLSRFPMYSYLSSRMDSSNWYGIVRKFLEPVLYPYFFYEPATMSVILVLIVSWGNEWMLW